MLSNYVGSVGRSNEGGTGGMGNEKVFAFNHFLNENNPLNNALPKIAILAISCFDCNEIW